MDDKTEILREKIYCDMQMEIFNYYDSQNIKYKKTEPADKTIVNFFSYLLKLIPPIKRTVHFSNELSNKIEDKKISDELIDILDQFKKDFENGIDMTIYLSNNIKEPHKPDFLRYTWKIYHLHMSKNRVESIDQMKNNRSDTQLLCIITATDVYFIDVIFHPSKPEDYFDINHLKIIANNNWMKFIGFEELKNVIPNSINFKVLTNRDIFEFYSQAGLNTSFEVEGKLFTTMKPLMLSKVPFDSADQLRRINRHINHLNIDEKDYLGFKFESNEQGHLLGMVEYRDSEQVTKFVNIL